MPEARVSRWLSASRVHDGQRFFQEKIFLGIDEVGGIAVISKEKPEAPIEEYAGWITPGFINVHCHLELSHMAGKIPKKTGLPHFLEAVVSGRNAANDATTKEKNLIKTLQKAEQAGIVAFGDIANTAESASAKAQSKLYFHTFFEAIGKVPQSAEKAFQHCLQVIDEFQKAAPDLPYSIVPHAPYSVSDELYRLIDRYQEDSILCIHNQECAAETELFQKGEGAFIDFYQKMNIPIGLGLAKKMSSLQWVLQQTNSQHPLILVHNTCTDASDLEAIKARAGSTFLCLCPNANLYIEDRLPDVKMLQQSGITICLGTDSLASNDQIDICAEMRSLHQHFPQISEEEIIGWACHNGARALQVAGSLGSIRPGTAPGLVHLDPHFQNAVRIA